MSKVKQYYTDVAEKAVDKIILQVKQNLISKDSAITKIKNFKSENDAYCIANYRKKQEFGVPEVKIDEFICLSNNIYNQADKILDQN